MADDVNVVTASGAVPVPATLEAAQAALASAKVENSVLRDELAKADDALANRDLEDFASVIQAESKDFWRKQLLDNRAETLVTLQGLVAAKKALSDLPVPPVVVPPVPLHNRNTARPVPPAVLAVPSGDAVGGKEGKIRNRAHELVKAQRLPFAAAFRRAEQEFAE